MAAGRKLIVVSNRGPVSFALNEDGHRVARRGGGGLVTALRSLVAHHDVTWIASAMTDEDRALAAESGDEAIDEVAGTGRLQAAARRARPGGLRLVLQRGREPDALVPPALPLGPRAAPDLDPGLHHAWDDGYVPVNGPSPTPCCRARGEPEAAVFFHDYHLYLAPASCATCARTRCSATSCTSRGRSRTTRACSPSRSASRSTRACSRTTSSASTRTGGSELPAELRDLLEADCDFERRRRSAPGRQDVVAAAAYLGRSLEFERACRERARAAARRRARGARPEFLILRVDRTDPSKNVVRGFRAFEHYLDAHPGDARAGRDARAARPVAAGHPRVRGVPRRDPAGRARRERPLPARRLDAARPRSRGQLPADGRRVQAVRRAARERDLRRAEPRREGGAARQRARRRARSSPRTPARTRSSGDGRSP